MMKKCLFLALFLLVLTNFAEAGPKTIVLENEYLTATIAPQWAGRIISLGKVGSPELTGYAVGDHTQGLAKERLFGDNWEFARLAYETVEEEKDRLVLWVRGKERPYDHLEVTKTYTLPPETGYLKVELHFRNFRPLMPLEGRPKKIAPWVHNVVMMDEVSGASNTFYLPHQEGVHLAYRSPLLGIQQPSFLTTANWMAFMDKKRGAGLLIASSPAPKILYSWISPERLASLEMLFPKRNPVPYYKITYYLVPIERLCAKVVQNSGLPLNLFPALPAPGEDFVFQNRPPISLSAAYAEAKEKPLESKGLD